MRGLVIDAIRTQNTEKRNNDVSFVPVAEEMVAAGVSAFLGSVWGVDTLLSKS